MKTSMFAKLTLAAALMMTCTIMSGHAASERLLISHSDIERDFSHVELRIRDGSNELRTATVRFDMALKDKGYFLLTEKDVVRSYIRLDQARHRLELMPNRIENVKGEIFPYTSQHYRDKFNKIYLKYRTSAHELENKLQDFTLKLEQLHPCNLIKAYLEKFRKSAWDLDAQAFDDTMEKMVNAVNNSSTEEVLKKLKTDKSGNDSSGEIKRDGNPLPMFNKIQEALRNKDTGALIDILKQNPNSQEARDALIQLLTTDPNEPMSEADAQEAAKAIINGDIDAITRLLKKYPKNQALREAAQRLGIKTSQGGGSKPTETEITKAQKDIVETLGQAQIVVDPDWTTPKWDDVKNELVMGPNVSRTYLGQKGGRLTQETEVTATWRRGDTKPQITYGKKTAWSIQVEKGGPGYQIVNMSIDGGEIVVESWTVTGQGGNVVKSGTGADVAVDFPGSGRYTIKASGKTKPGNSPFAIEQFVDVQK